MKRWRYTTEVPGGWFVTAQLAETKEQAEAAHLKKHRGMFARMDPPVEVVEED